MGMVTLPTIVQKCLKDKAFFEALRADLKKALQGQGWQLSDTDMAELVRIVNDKNMICDFEIWSALMEKYGFPGMEKMLPIW